MTEDTMRGWTITGDRLYEGDDFFKSRVGTSGSGPNGPAIRFRLKDDDGTVYYEGLLADDDESLAQMDALDYGTADAGCTTIEVWRNGKWTQEIG